MEHRIRAKKQQHPARIIIHICLLFLCCWFIPSPSTACFLDALLREGVNARRLLPSCSPSILSPSLCLRNALLWTSWLCDRSRCRTCALRIPPLPKPHSIPASTNATHEPRFSFFFCWIVRERIKLICKFIIDAGNDVVQFALLRPKLWHFPFYVLMTWITKKKQELRLYSCISILQGAFL